MTKQRYRYTLGASRTEREQALLDAKALGQITNAEFIEAMEEIIFGAPPKPQPSKQTNR